MLHGEFYRLNPPEILNNLNIIAPAGFARSCQGLRTGVDLDVCVHRETGKNDRTGTGDHQFLLVLPTDNVKKLQACRADFPGLGNGIGDDCLSFLHEVFGLDEVGVIGAMGQKQFPIRLVPDTHHLEPSVLAGRVFGIQIVPFRRFRARVVRMGCQTEQILPLRQPWRSECHLFQNNRSGETEPIQGRRTDDQVLAGER